MAFLGPSLAGKSNRITGTLTLTRWAAICAPMTPAPRTATLRTLNRFIEYSRVLLDTLPGLRATQQGRADVAAHVELLAAVDQLQLGAVDLAVVRIEDVAAFPDGLVVAARLHVADDRHADDRLVLAVVGAVLADGVLRRVGIDDLLDLAGVDATALDDAHQRLLLLGVVVDGLPQARGRRLGSGQAG